jgi:hypothetical protein
MKLRVKSPKKKPKNDMFGLGSEEPEIYASLAVLFFSWDNWIIRVLMLMLTVCFHSIRVLPRDEPTVQLITR